MNEPECVAELELLISSMAREAIVDLEEVRKLRQRLDVVRLDKKWDELSAWLKELERENGEALYQLGGTLLLEWIVKAIGHCSADGEPDAALVTDWLVQRGHTWKLSRQLRRFYSYVYEVPVVHVSAHVREGRPVRAHSRLIGNDHLRALSTVGWKPIVDGVVRFLAERISF